MTDTLATGGCQCGAVRYRITAPFENPHICHCRMCQKAFGNYFAALVGTKKTALHWTRGEPAFFRSSEIVPRGFCRDCGTPLFMLEDGHGVIEIAIGSLDDPNAIAPESVIYLKDAVAWDFFDPALPKFDGMSPRRHHVARPSEDRPDGQ